MSLQRSPDLAPRCRPRARRGAGGRGARGRRPRGRRPGAHARGRSVGSPSAGLAGRGRRRDADARRRGHPRHRLRGRTTTELLGAGDVLRPWEDDVQSDPLPFTVVWHVHERTRVALLDARFAMATARWPALAGAISRRHVRRARALSFQLAIAQLPRVDDRLLVLLWAMAERWGRVAPQGVRLPRACRTARWPRSSAPGARRSPPRSADWPARASSSEPRTAGCCTAIPPRCSPRACTARRRAPRRRSASGATPR